MATIDEVKTKLHAILDRKQDALRTLDAVVGDTRSQVYVRDSSGNNTNRIYVRLDDGSYYGEVYHFGRFPIGDASAGMKIVIGYTTGQPDVLQTIEPREGVWTAPATPPATKPANVTGLAATWSQRDCLITWNAVAGNPLFHNYLVIINSIYSYHPTVNRLNYTRTMNEADNGSFDPSLDITIVAVDEYGLQSATPAALTTTWVRPTLPNVTSGSASWNNDDCLITWSDIVKPYTFVRYLVTVGAVVYAVAGHSLLYTNEMNRIDHGGTPADTLVISIVAEDDGGYTSPTPYVINTANVNPTGDTVVDNFNTYGGDIVAQNGNAALYWLSLIEGEGDSDEVLFGGLTILDTAHVVQGAKAIRLYADTLSSVAKDRAEVYDLTAEGRFTNNDYFTLSVYCASASEQLIVMFHDTTPASEQYTWNLSTGWNYLKVKRSDLTGPTLDWSQIDRIQLVRATLNGYIWLDDARIAKADPDNASAFNDTGAAWDFSGGTWHVYQDVSGVTYALGQIDGNSPGTRQVALKMGSYVVSNHAAAGVYLRADGAAGLMALATDASNGYEVKINSSTDTIKLLKWVSGVSTELASVAHTFAPNTRYYLGLLRQGSHVLVFVSTSNSNLFSSPSLVAYVSDSTYKTGKIGVVSYGVNSRFFQVRAGSPQHALSAEMAFDSDTVDGLHSDDLLALERMQTAEGTILALAQWQPYDTSDAPPWQIQMQSSANTSPGVGYDHGVFLGFNAGRAIGGPGVITGQPAILMGFEDNYYDPGPALYGSEWYVEFWSPDGTTVQRFRPFYARISPNDNTADQAFIKMNIGAGAGQLDVMADISTILHITKTDFVTPLLVSFTNNTEVVDADTASVILSGGMYVTKSLMVGLLTQTALLNVSGTLTYAASDRVKFGVIDTLPSNNVGDYIGWANGVSGTSAGDLLLIPRSDVAGTIRLYAGSGTPVQIANVSSSGLTVLIKLLLTDIAYPGAGTKGMWSQSGYGTVIQGQGTTTDVYITDRNGNVSLVVFNGGNVAIGTTTDGMTAGGSLAIAKDLAHRGTKVGFYNGTPVVRGGALTAQLTTITHTAPGTPDYAIQDFTQTSPWGFASHDEANTVMSVIKNLQTRVAELEARLGSATGVNLFA